MKMETTVVSFCIRDCASTGLPSKGCINETHSGRMSEGLIAGTSGGINSSSGEEGFRNHSLIKLRMAIRDQARVRPVNLGQTFRLG